MSLWIVVPLTWLALAVVVLLVVGRISKDGRDDEGKQKPYVAPKQF